MLISNKVTTVQGSKSYVCIIICQYIMVIAIFGDISKLSNEKEAALVELSKEQLIELIERIINVEEDEKEIDLMINLLERNVPHPEVSDLIFWNNNNYTAEQIMEIALNYKSIQL